MNEKIKIQKERKENFINWLLKNKYEIPINRESQICIIIDNIYLGLHVNKESYDMSSVSNSLTIKYETHTKILHVINKWKSFIHKKYDIDIDGTLECKCAEYNVKMFPQDRDLCPRHGRNY